MAAGWTHRAMTLEARFESYMAQALKLDKFDRWDEEWQWLEKAKKLIDDAIFDDKVQYQQRVLYEMGRIYARMGRYEDAIQKLEDALTAVPRDNSVMKAKIYGELGTIYRFQGDSENAQEAFKYQYILAYEMSVKTEAEMCSSVGNEGMAALSRYQLSESSDRNEKLLSDASLQIRERVRLAQKLWTRLDDDEKSSVMRLRYGSEKAENFDSFIKEYKEKCEIWQIEGYDRLSLCCIEEAELVRARDPGKAEEAHATALDVATESQILQHKWMKANGEEHTTARALSLFFYGNALFVNGREKEALEIWNAKKGIKGPAHALCQQPAAEHVRHVKRMARAGALLMHPDEQGLTPLDHAHLSYSRNAQEMIDAIIKECLEPKLREYFKNSSSQLDPFEESSQYDSEDQIEADVKKRIQHLCDDAEVRRCYRDVLQEKIRPILLSKSKLTLQEIRETYARALAQDKKKRQHLDWFHYLRYEDFQKANRLPHADLDHALAKAQPFQVRPDGSENKELFIIFFSYRWIGRQSNKLGPDDSENSQYKRMLGAAAAYLNERRRDLDPGNVGIWLDYACISQQDLSRKGRGVNALPLAVAQCDVIISLTDDEYYKRAWCAVEVRLSRELLGHSHHEWREHILSQSGGRVNGTLLARDEKPPEDSELGPGLLSYEAEDRPKVDFLKSLERYFGKDMGSKMAFESMTNSIAEPQEMNARSGKH